MTAARAMTAPAPADVTVTVTRLDGRAVRVTLDCAQVTLSADLDRDAAIRAGLAILTYAGAGALEINTDAGVVAWGAPAPEGPDAGASS